MRIRTFTESDTEAVVGLWQACGLTRPWNDPYRDIVRKLTTQPELFLVGEKDDRLVASAMAGFDGHRGAVYYLAVLPEYQGLGFGRQLMDEVESLLTARGCPKLNIMVRTTNVDVLAFYEKSGYATDEVVCMGKRLIPDV